MLQNITLILSSVSLNAFAQIFIRQGMLKHGKVSLDVGQLWSMIIEVFSNLWLILGMFSYGISIILWMVVLSKVSVSLAYPFLSIGYIITAIIAYFVFQEPLTIQKITGIMVICAGVYILTQSRDFVS